MDYWLNCEGISLDEYSGLLEFLEENKIYHVSGTQSGRDRNDYWFGCKYFAIRLYGKFFYVYTLSHLNLRPNILYLNKNTSLDEIKKVIGRNKLVWKGREI